MSNGSASFEPSASTTDSLEYTGPSSRTNRNRRLCSSGNDGQQLPVLHEDGHLGSIGLGVDSSDVGFVQDVLGNSAAGFIDLHALPGSYNDVVRVQGPFSEPWTPYSAHQAQGERPAAERPWQEILNLPPELRGSQQNFRLPAETSFGPTAGSQEIRPQNALHPNWLPPGQAYMLVQNAAWPIDVPWAPATTINTPQTQQWPIPYSDSLGLARERFVPSTWPIDAPPTSINAPQAQQWLNPYPDNVSPARERVILSNSLPHLNPPNATATSSRPQEPVPLNRTNLQRQQLQLPPVRIPRVSPSSSSANRHRWECEHCRQGFTREADLDRHITAQHGDTSYQCTFCGHQTRRQDKMKEHCRNHHGQVQFITVVDDSE